MPMRLFGRCRDFVRRRQGGDMGLQAGGAPASRGAAGHGNGGRQSHAPARLLGVRVKLAALESGAAQAALAHDCV
ncbi:hypothetical protein D3C72_1716300 [compost metagenome]